MTGVGVPQIDDRPRFSDVIAVLKRNGVEIYDKENSTPKMVVCVKGETIYTLPVSLSVRKTIVSKLAIKFGFGVAEFYHQRSS